MKWMRERDLLIAQTLEFVQSVSGKKPAADSSFATDKSFATNPIAPATNTVAPPVPRFPVATPSAARAPAPMHDIAALLAVSGAVVESPKPALAPAPPARSAPPARPDLRDDFQAEIKARVANFRAHQERFSREREAFCSATMAKVHASIKETELPPRLGK